MDTSKDIGDKVRHVNVLILLDIASFFPRPASEILEGVSRLVAILDHLADGKTRVGYGWVSSALTFIEDSVKNIDRPPSGKQGSAKAPGGFSQAPSELCLACTSFTRSYVS